MRVEALSSIKSASVEWTSSSGQRFTTIAAKLTFDIHPTQIALAAEQEEIVAADQYYDEDPGRSLYAPSDLAPFKARADVVVVGHAFAPNREPARVVRVRLAIRECDKAIEVFGDRAWGMDGEIREGPRFVKMPLRWERAAGGPYTANPIGIRSDVQDSLGRILVPNLVIAGKHLERRGEAIETAGLGPVAPSWPARRPLGDVSGGKIGQAEPAFYNCAPADQQLAELPEDELLILENLHPTASTVSARLPGIRPRAFLERGEAGTEIPLRCDTLWIDTDRAVLTLTWRGRLAEDQQGVVWLVTEHRGSQVTWATVVAARAAAASLGDLDPSSVTHVPTTKEPPVKAPEHLPFAGKTRADGDPHKTFHSAPPTWAGVPPAASSPLAQLGAMTAQSSSYPAPPAPVAPPPVVSGSVAPPPVVSGSVAPPPVVSGSVAPPPVMAAAPSPAPLAPQATVSMKAVDSAVEASLMPAAAASPSLQGEALHVIWFDPAPERGAVGRAAVARALLTGKRLDGEQLARALPESVDDTGELVLPNVVVAGELALRFDPLARLKATLGVARSQAASNKHLAELCREGMLLATSELPLAPGAAEASAARIREAADGRRELDESVERVLILRRAYERLDLLGGPRLQATLSLPRGGAVTVYVPASAAVDLPLVARFPAVVLADVRPPQDPYDPSPVALLASAIGRLVSIG